MSETTRLLILSYPQRVLLLARAGDRLSVMFATGPAVRIGVDVGGTNTDAVVMDGQRVLATHKTPTTEVLSRGIARAITEALESSATRAADVQQVMIGTTHFTNAFVERRGLLPVGILRIALPSSRGVPPLSDWPQDMAEAVGGGCHLIRGGYRYDGKIADDLDEAMVANAARRFAAAGLRTVAITGLFSPVNAAMEVRARDIVLNEAPDLAITLSSKIGRMGILERENAAIMNASLADLSRDVVSSFENALGQLGVEASFFISQNDGTLMSAETVERYPVLTFASGPTNSMRGAAYLSELKDALIVDIGGTTTDIGVLLNGFPRESSLTTRIGGVRTNFRMPDVLSLGLGGGSLVETSGGEIRIGPESLGYRLTRDGRVFGGDRLCATDLAVASGYATLGDRSLVSSLSKQVTTNGVDLIHKLLADGVDRMKSSSEPVPLVLVGGGSVLVRDDIPGASETIVPEHAEVANAIGASIAQVSGETDRVFAYEASGRDSALETAVEQAKARAVENGANADSLEIMDIEEFPLAYMPGGAVRVRVKVAGDLQVGPKRTLQHPGH